MFCVAPYGFIIKGLGKDAQIIITSWGCPKLDLSILDVAPDLKMGFHAAGSVKGIVTPELLQHGIRVSSAAEMLGRGVAETALGLTIASLKQFWKLAASTKTGEWNAGRELVRELYDVTVGVIGAGWAGRQFIQLLNHFDVEILLYDPILTSAQAQELGAKKVSLEELMKASDVVSIHAPSIPETNNMINSRMLSLMKNRAILINTARGDSIDDTALVAELEAGRIFACLDVTDPEPPSADHPFRGMKNVILTPHIAGAVSTGLRRIGKYTVEELQRYLNGVKMNGEVTLDRLSIIA